MILANQFHQQHHVKVANVRSYSVKPDQCSVPSALSKLELVFHKKNDKIVYSL